METKVEIFLLRFTDPLLGESCGADVRIRDDAATVEDLLAALDDFAAQHLADCYGCDACCQERAPLLAADLPALAALCGADGFPAHAVCRAYARLSIDKNGATDITLRRDADNACMFLHRDGRYCTVWTARPFVCRSHFCLPRSDRLERLRQDIVNLGENELTRLLLAEEGRGAAPLTGSPLASLIAPEDYPENTHSGRLSYNQIRIKDCVGAALWRQLIAE